MQQAWVGEVSDWTTMNSNATPQKTHANQEDAQQHLISFLDDIQTATSAAKVVTLVGDHAFSTASAEDLRRVFRSFPPLTPGVHKSIDQAASTIAVYGQLRSRKEADERAFEGATALLKLYQRWSSPALRGVSNAILKALIDEGTWGSSEIGSFARRIAQDPRFQEVIIRRIVSEPLPDLQAPSAPPSSNDILEAVEQGISKSGILQQQNDADIAIDSMLSWWNHLHPDLRNFSVSVIVGVLLLVLEYQVFVKDQPNQQLPARQRIEIVQNFTDNIFINTGDNGEVRQLQVVIDDRLSVFQSNRRDSDRIATLNAGQSVSLKTHKRTWTQIEWRDVNNHEMRAGWVLTRYLKRK